MDANGGGGSLMYILFAVLCGHGMFAICETKVIDQGFRSKGACYEYRDSIQHTPEFWIRHSICLEQ
jgi:hypothetical protein